MKKYVKILDKTKGGSFTRGALLNVYRLIYMDFFPKNIYFAIMSCAVVLDILKSIAINIITLVFQN